MTLRCAVLAICLGASSLVANAQMQAADCLHDADRGYLCDAAQPTKKYFYHAASDTCQPLFYRGCGGNDNRFDTQAFCNQVCKPDDIVIGNGASPLSVGDGAVPETPSPIGSGTSHDILMDARPESAEFMETTVYPFNMSPTSAVTPFNPFHPGPVVVMNESRNSLTNCKGNFGAKSLLVPSCLTYYDCPEDFECHENVCCPTKSAVCNQQYDSGYELRELSHVGRYYYIPAGNNCARFSYFGAGGNFNNFQTYNDCMDYCATFIQ